MSVCCCSLAGTAACQHCSQNPFATEVWTSKTVTVDHVDAKPFGNGLDVCPVCGKPTTFGKPQTNADRVRAMTDEELAAIFTSGWYDGPCFTCPVTDVECERVVPCDVCFLDWLKAPVEVDE